MHMLGTQGEKALLKRSLQMTANFFWFPTDLTLTRSEFQRVGVSKCKVPSFNVSFNSGNKK